MSKSFAPNSANITPPPYHLVSHFLLSTHLSNPIPDAPTLSNHEVGYPHYPTRIQSCLILLHLTLQLLNLCLPTLSLHTHLLQHLPTIESPPSVPSTTTASTVSITHPQHCHSMQTGTKNSIVQPILHCEMSMQVNRQINGLKG
jgi:hypothetical protein